MSETNSGPMRPSGGKIADSWGWTPPLAWVALIMLLSVRGLYSMMPFAWEPSLPPFLSGYFKASVGVAVVNLLWGGWMLAAARSGSRALRRGFLAWQSFNIVALTFSVGYTTFVAEFVTTAYSLLIPVVEFVIGIALIVYVLRLPDAPVHAGHPSSPPAEGNAPTAGRYLFNAVIGGILGAVIGGVAGFPLGALLADLLDISCFEGGCGYFAVAIGLLLILVGLIVGIIIAVLRTRRAARPRLI